MACYPFSPPESSSWSTQPLAHMLTVLSLRLVGSVRKLETRGSLSESQKRGHDSETIDSRFGEHSAYRTMGVRFTYDSSTYRCASCMDAISGAECIPQSPQNPRIRLGQHRAHSQLATSVGASLTGKVFMVPTTAVGKISIPRSPPSRLHELI